MKPYRLKSLFILFIIIAGSLVSSCKKDKIDLSKPLTVDQINAQINELMNENGDFSWKDASNHLVWSAIIQGGGCSDIGYSNYSVFDEGMTQEVLDEIEADKEIIQSKILEIEKTEDSDLTLEDIILHDSDSFTHLTVIIKLQETVKQVRTLSQFRFIEPDYDKYEY